MTDTEHLPQPLDPYARLQTIARSASLYCLVAAAAVFLGGAILLVILLSRLDSDGVFGPNGATLAHHLQIILSYGAGWLVPTILLAVAGIALRLYAESQAVREERHAELLDTFQATDVGAPTRE